MNVWANERKGMSEDESQVFFNCQYLLSGWWVIDDASQFTIEGEKWESEFFLFNSLTLNLVKGKKDMSRMARRMSNQQVKWLFCLTLVNLVLFRESADNESDGEKTWREEKRGKIMLEKKNPEWRKEVREESVEFTWIILSLLQVFGFFPVRFFGQKSGCRFQLQFLVDG